MKNPWHFIVMDLACRHPVLTKVSSSLSWMVDYHCSSLNATSLLHSLPWQKPSLISRKVQWNVFYPVQPIAVKRWTLSCKGQHVPEALFHARQKMKIGDIPVTSKTRMATSGKLFARRTASRLKILLNILCYGFQAVHFFQVYILTQ